MVAQFDFEGAPFPGFKFLRLNLAWYFPYIAGGSFTVG
jgi:hypothetical protein